MRFSVYQESHIGGRPLNEDRMGYCFTRESLLLLLADGMGGHIQGEVAATIAMQTIGILFQKNAAPHIQKPEKFLEDSFLAAHHAICRYRDEKNLSETPRTTIVACLIQHNNAYWAHCGDSRLYWMRDGHILARTRDHSRVETLIAQGKVDASARSTHPDRNKLFNCLGAPNFPIVELSRRSRLQAGDIVLLCSDGLWGVLPDHVLAESLHQNTVVRAVSELVETAVQTAGKYSDNVTGIAIMWEGSEREPDAHMVVTNTLPMGTVTTTIHAIPESDLQDVEPFNDRAIEDAIAEIREAIQKSNRLTAKN